MGTDPYISLGTGLSTKIDGILEVFDKEED